MGTRSLEPHRPLNRQDCKTLFLAALGGALEFYDFIIFVFFAVVLGKLFFPPSMPDWLSQLQTFGIFAAGYLARPLGGIVMAHFGDLMGRKRMFTLSIVLMALPTLAMGMLPTYHDIGIAAPLLLLAMRILQGAAIGGEVPGAWVFVAEHAPARHTGFACSVITSGLTIGILLGSLIATAINLAFSPQQIADWAWRVPFLVGGVFGVVAMQLRQWLHETPVFAEMQARKALSEELPLKTVLKKHKAAVALSMLVTWFLAISIVVAILMAPAYLQKQFGLPAVDTLRANSLAIVALTLGCLVAGVSSDRLGSGPTFIAGSLLLGASSYAFYSSMAAHGGQLYTLYPLLGFSVGIVGAVPLVMVRAFPAQVRFSGLSFSYNVAYAFAGGLTPILLSIWLKYDALAPAYYLMLQCLIGLLVGCYLLLAGKKTGSAALAQEG
ncbi:MFS transporter [Chromobacterium violaceum]|uniref:MFS transporter n=1 Tax=Chromobacterium violaceum TaxID=536 RepID=UPI00065495D9|nr:MFS transporter [Chromobacterium violaceum]KMN47939.1 MFS transporter [Chromobacterium violaceum]KMN86565.1 MFS transporter [Chromobacterium violaceum]KMN92056.1 MFS transporter [Chromobacterium violaceum]KMO04201.1 MFS transporter [Chromobacterium violaceum]